MSRSQDFPSEATSLVNLISSSIQTIVTEYAIAGKQIPSLDSTIPGPFDRPEATSDNLSKAVQIVEAACAQLTALVASPGHTMINRALGHMDASCFRVVINAKIADILVDRPSGLHVKELAEKSGLEPGKLRRILQFLVTQHCFIELTPDVFANNRLSVKLLSTDPLSSIICFAGDESMKSSAYLDEVLTDPDWGHSDLPEGAPFFFVNKTSLFDFYAKSKPRSDRFAQAMVGWGDVTGKGMLPKIYPWETLPKDTVICDVAGGNGHKSLLLLRQFPQLKAVVQDEGLVITEAKKFWEIEAPTLVQNDRVQFTPLDFFVDSPVHGGDIYFLSRILHDWSDEKCVIILKNVRKVMAVGSKLMINDVVIPPVVREGENSQFDQAPKPLLPNYGVGRIRPYYTDIMIMLTVNAKERTLDEFIKLATLCGGLRFEKLWDGGELGLVEFVAV